MSANTVARLKITLDAVKPTVRRRIEVPFDIRLDRLHLTIQAALGWTNSHLYEIRAGDVGWSTLYPEADWPEDFLDARKARLDKVLTSDEIRNLINEAYGVAREILVRHKDKLVTVSERLIAEETIEGPVFDEIMGLSEVAIRYDL